MNDDYGAKLSVLAFSILALSMALFALARAPSHHLDPLPLYPDGGDDTTWTGRVDLHPDGHQDDWVSWVASETNFIFKDGLIVKSHKDGGIEVLNIPAGTFVTFADGRTCKVELDTDVEVWEPRR